MYLELFHDTIFHLIKTCDYTHKDVSNYLRGLGMAMGSSVANINLFCERYDIHRFDYGQMNQLEVQEVCRRAIETLGPTYGRKMTTGAIRSHGYRLGERVVRNALENVAPIYTYERRNGAARNFNPMPYYAQYAGHKLHMDQNEKLVQYGVTHTCAVDGYSKKIVGFSSMPVKNNITIYDEVYSDAVGQYGLFDQVRVDHGREFYLTLYHQDNIREYRNNTRRPPYIQTQSTLNHAVERIWVGVNARVNYPIKEALIDLVNDDLIDMNCETTKYCVSHVTLNVCKVGINNFIQSWNCHSIPGKGIPNDVFQQSSAAVPISPEDLPPGHIVANDYMNHGGRMTLFGQFGSDPLDHDAQLLREQIFDTQYPDLTPLMGSLANRNRALFQNALLHFIDVTNRLILCKMNTLVLAKTSRKLEFS